MPTPGSAPASPSAPISRRNSIAQSPPNYATAGTLANATALDSGADLRKKVDTQLQYTTQLLYDMEVTAGYVVEERQDFMEKSVNQLIESYEKLSRLASSITDTVPTDTLLMIDDGINPHEFTKKTLNGALTSSQWANGKVQAFEHGDVRVAAVLNHIHPTLMPLFFSSPQSYRTLLSTMLSESFPDLNDGIQSGQDVKPQIR